MYVFGFFYILNCGQALKKMSFVSFNSICLLHNVINFVSPTVFHLNLPSVLLSSQFLSNLFVLYVSLM